jgi:hypothetical protein
MGDPFCPDQLIQRDVHRIRSEYSPAQNVTLSSVFQSVLPSFASFFFFNLFSFFLYLYIPFLSLFPLSFHSSSVFLFCFILCLFCLVVFSLFSHLRSFLSLSVLILRQFATYHLSADHPCGALQIFTKTSLGHVFEGYRSGLG